MKVHGIAVRDVKSNKLIDFIKCEIGRSALRVLSGIRMNMSDDYRASEELIEEAETINL